MGYAKGAESFIYVLGAGIGIFLIIALVMSDINFSVSQNTGDLRDEEYLLNNKDIKSTIKEGEIYYFDKFVYKSLGELKINRKHVFIGDVEVGSDLAYRLVREESAFEVENGVFGRKFKEILFEVENAKKVRISFVVNRTNKYGNLIVRINNRVVFNNITREGERILIDIDSTLNGKNIVSFEAENSLPKIWAPTKYEIIDLRIEVLDVISKKGYIEYELLPYEFEGLKHVEVKFNVIDSNLYDKLKIISNGVGVYEDVFEPSSKPYVVWLYRKDNLKQGINVINLATGEGSYYKLKNVEVNVYYYGNAKRFVNENTFVIEDDEYRYIDKNMDALEGVVEIKTQSVDLDKGIKIYINGAEYEINNLRVYASNYITFDPVILKKGTNTFSWETEGSYALEYIKIGVRKKQ